MIIDGKYLALRPDYQREFKKLFQERKARVALDADTGTLTFTAADNPPLVMTVPSSGWVLIPAVEYDPAHISIRSDTAELIRAFRSEPIRTYVVEGFLLVLVQDETGNGLVLGKKHWQFDPSAGN